MQAEGNSCRRKRHTNNKHFKNSHRANSIREHLKDEHPDSSHNSIREHLKDKHPEKYTEYKSLRPKISSTPVVMKRFFEQPTIDHSFEKHGRVIGSKCVFMIEKNTIEVIERVSDAAVGGGGRMRMTSPM